MVHYHICKLHTIKNYTKILAVRHTYYCEFLHVQSHKPAHNNSCNTFHKKIWTSLKLCLKKQRAKKVSKICMHTCQTSSSFNNTHSSRETMVQSSRKQFYKMPLDDASCLTCHTHTHEVFYSWNEPLWQPPYMTFHVKSTQFRSKIFRTISNSNKICNWLGLLWKWRGQNISLSFHTFSFTKLLLNLILIKT